MKTLKISFGLIILSVIFSVNANAQLKVESGGRVLTGNATSPETSDASYLMQLYSLNGTDSYNSKQLISFGNKGNSGFDAYIGKYTFASGSVRGKLYMFGAEGISFETRHGTAFSYSPLYNSNFTFSCPLWVQGTTYSSDIRYKENIVNLKSDKSLALLKQLNGVSYDLKVARKFEDETTKDKNLQSGELKTSGQIGFIAQDFQKVLPELVSENQDGYLGINYIGLIPVIVEALKEQNLIIEDLKAEVETLKADKDIVIRKSAASPDNDNSVLEGSVAASLQQNAPNPFSQSTQIKYYLPETVATAYLCIYDLQGKQLKQILISERGESSQTISGSEFRPGIYLYALLADGKEIDVKRMILTE